MRTGFLLIPLLAVSALLATVPATARESDDRVVMTSAGFLGAHPDMRWRLLGMEEYEKGRHAAAITAFRNAARYADKPSQSMLAEMYWKGQGVPADRVMGYIWMDLAAERAYPWMIAKREGYWEAMSEEERARALELGPSMYDEYGDAVAQPRIASVLKRARRNITGSRTGSVGNLQIQIPVAGGGTRVIRGDDYYAEHFWEPEQYFEWQDADWRAPATGTVDVGEVINSADARADEAGTD